MAAPRAQGNTSGRNATRAHSVRRDPFESVLDRYQGLPRAARWGVVAVVAMGGFMLLDSVIWPAADELNSKADRYEALLVRASSRADELPGNVVYAAIAYGGTSVPTLEEAGKEKLTAAIAEIFKKRNINLGQDVRPAQVLPQTVLPKIVAEKAPGGRMGRTVVEIQFDAQPDVVTAILNELEQSEAVDAIGDVRMSYNGGTKRVTVKMSVEKWGVVPTNQGGGA